MSWQDRPDGLGRRLDAWAAQADRRLSILARSLERSRGGRFALDTLRGFLTVLHHLRGEPILDRAGSLSYGTLFSLVPLVALGLVIAGTIGHAFLREKLEDFVLVFLAPGIRRSSMAYLSGVLDNATSGALGSLSGAALLFSAVTMLRSVENALNGIWGVTRTRSVRFRLAIYTLLLVVGPVFVGLSMAATAALKARLLTQVPFSGGMLALGPVLASVIGLMLLYYCVPNVAVEKRAAFAGALVSGIAWELAKHGYAYYAAHISRYGAIYGSIAAIPLLLLWIYLSWVILLFGARLAYAVQNAGSWGPAALPRTESLRARLAARTMLAAAVAAATRGPPPSVYAIALECGVSSAAIAESARLLARASLLSESSDGGLAPSRPLEQISLAQVAEAARGATHDDGPTLGHDPASRAIGEIFGRADHSAAEPLDRIDLLTLAQRVIAEARSPSPTTFAKA